MQTLFPVKKWLVKILCQPIVGKCLGLILQDQIPNRGCIIDTSSDVIVPSIKASLFWGFYEGAEVRFVKKYLRSELDHVELGSSIGVVSSHIARKLDSSRRMICVETNPRLLDQIEGNILHNSSLCNITIIHGAIDYASQTNGMIDFMVENRNVDSKISNGRQVKPKVLLSGIALLEILVQCFGLLGITMEVIITCVLGTILYFGAIRHASR